MDISFACAINFAMYLFQVCCIWPHWEYEVGNIAKRAGSSGAPYMFHISHGRQIWTTAKLNCCRYSDNNTIGVSRHYLIVVMFTVIGRDKMTQMFKLGFVIMHDQCRCNAFVCLNIKACQHAGNVIRLFVFDSVEHHTDLYTWQKLRTFNCACNVYFRMPAF